MLPALGLALLMLLPAVAALAPPAEPASAFIVRFGALPAGLEAGDEFGGGLVLRVDRALGFAVVSAPPVRLFGLGPLDNVLSVEEDAEVRVPEAAAVATAVDPRMGQQYGPQQVRAPEAWALTPGSADIRLCVVDTGIRHTHEDLGGARWLGGIDFANRDHDATDDHGHGTHVAGIAAATAGNGLGIAGLAQVGLLGVKALRADGGGRVSDVASGIRWCADQGAHIVSLSLGLRVPVQTLHDAIRYAQGKGALLIAAAGNDGACTDCVNYPAAYPEVVAVTCTDAQQRLCAFSSQGTQAELTAPGHQILSTYHSADDAYAAMSGTSMSAPHVSGVAALVWSAQPSLTGSQVRSILVGTARDIGAAGADAEFGHGLVDAYAAVLATRAGDSPTPRPQPAPVPTPAPNEAPVAEAGPTVRGADPDGDRVGRVRLDASASTDPDGTIVAYEWYRSRTLVATGPTPEVDLRTGRHTLTLRVIDDKGATDTDRVRVYVARNQDPVAAATMSCEGLTCTFDAGNSTDPEGGPLAFQWDFGAHEPTGAVVTYRFDEPGRHRVRLIVTDAGGDQDLISARVRVRG